MYRYIKRIRESLKLGVSARKTFSCQQNVKNDKRENGKSVLKAQEVHFLPLHCRYDEFRRRYNCKHPNSYCNIIQAITWSTALVAGFIYASQLICLYWRNHRLDPKKCFYTKYLCRKNQQFHKKFLFAQNEGKNKQRCVPNFKANEKQEVLATAAQSCQFDFKDFDLTGLETLFEKRFQRYYEDDDVTQRVYHVNDAVSRKTEVKNAHQSEDEKFEHVFSAITKMIGELELSLGLECISKGSFEEAVEHFKLSTNSNNNSACYNLALLYEHGLGVEQDYTMAKRLYQLAAEWDHPQAFYNLGIFFANGLGGKKSFRQAKLCFRKAAMLGDKHASVALSMIQPSKLKFSPVPEDFISADQDEDFSLGLQKNRSLERKYMIVG